MGPTHAMSGAAAWLVAAPAIEKAVTGAVTPEVALAGAGVAAGAALLPDIDSPQATVSRSFGVASMMVAEVVNAVAAGFYNLSRSSRDEMRTNGHRTITHTAIFTVGLGVAVAVLCGVFGKYAVAAVVFVCAGLAVRGLMADWAKREGWVGVTVVSALAAGWVLWTFPSDNYWWLGVAVAVGATMHLLGDMVTKQGCPIMAPFPVRGKRWWEFTTPVRITAGGWFEKVLLLPLLTVVTVLAAAATVFPHETSVILGR